MPFGFIDNGTDKEEKFELLQQFLLEDETQEKLANKGLRTWYGRTNDKTDKKIFNPE